MTDETLIELETDPAIGEPVSGHVDDAPEETVDENDIVQVPVPDEENA